MGDRTIEEVDPCEREGVSASRPADRFHGYLRVPMYHAAVHSRTWADQGHSVYDSAGTPFA